MNDIHVKPATGKTPSTDFITLAARYSLLGWVAFLVTLILLVAQTLFMTLKEPMVLASVNGEVVGQVIFDEARLRADEDIIRDAKHWLARCMSLDKHTIYDDLSVCVKHMDVALAQQRLDDYQANHYPETIELYGCQETSINFDPEQTTLHREAMATRATITLAGSMTCFNQGQPPNIKAFATVIHADLIGRTTATPLALRVTSFRDKGLGE